MVDIVKHEPDIGTRVARFVKIRDVRRMLKERYEKEDEIWKVALEKLQGELQAFLDTNNLKNVKTPAGTFYSSVRYTASLSDPEAFMKFVINNNQFDLLDRRANATAVKDYIKENNQPPPGCNLSAIQTVGVRRSGEKKDEE